MVKRTCLRDVVFCELPWRVNLQSTVLNCFKALGNRPQEDADADFMIIFTNGAEHFQSTIKDADKKQARNQAISKRQHIANIQTLGIRTRKAKSQNCTRKNKQLDKVWHGCKTNTSSGQNVESLYVFAWCNVLQGCMVRSRYETKNVQNVCMTK